MISSVARAACDLNSQLSTRVGMVLLKEIAEDDNLALMSTSELKVALAEAFAAGQEHREPSPWSWGRIGEKKQRPTTLSFEKHFEYEIKTASGDVVRRSYVEES